MILQAEENKGVDPMWLNGRRTITTEKRTSTNPSRPMEIIGVFQNATADMARKAVEDAHKYFDTWKKVSPQERAKFLFRAAQIVRERKFELNALVCYEVGKTWTEADADIAETIDFLEYYGREMLRLGEPQKLVPMRGERNYLVYIPLGVGVIIPPWNFPCAIMAGMTAASLVTGNTVVLKPAADSPTIAAKFIDILFEAGIPKEAVNFITGPGSVIGDVLVQHPKTRYIGFTGSKEVGLRISELAGKTVPGQMWIKRTVLEMGGKDGIVVDEEADIDAAVEGTVQAAFGDQGEEFRSGARNCEQYGIWIDRRGVLKKPGKNSEGRRDISRRQSLSEPEVHRRDGWSTPVWRIQHVRDGLESGRERLFAAVYAGQVDRGKSELRTFSRDSVGALRDPLQNAKDRIAEHEHG